MNVRLCLFSFILMVSLLRESSTTPSCDKNTCLHGTCENNVCVCESCWTGTNCAQSANTKPAFSQPLYKVSIAEKSQDISKPLMTVSATDPDRCKDKSESCPCAQIVYAVTVASLHAHLFTVDKHSGALKSREVLPPGIYTLGLQARNEAPFGGVGSRDSQTIVEIEISPPPAVSPILSRSKRLTANAPSAITFLLQKVYPTESVTSIKFGSKIKFQLTISFPTTSTSLSVEIFAPDASIDVMGLCNIKAVSAGSQIGLNINTLNSNAQMLGKESATWPVSRAVFNLGTVQAAAATSNADADYQLVIEFEAVMLYNTQATNNAVYWVSAGAEYDNEDKIWVCQASYTADTDEDTTTYNPTFTLTGSEDMFPGRTSVYNLKMFLPQRYADLSLSVFAPLNQSSLMSVCFVNQNGLGEGYGCINKGAITSSLSKLDPTFTNNYKGTLNFGVLTNKMSLDPAATNADKTIDIVTSLRLTDTATVGEIWYMGMSVTIKNSVIWSGTKTVTVQTAQPLANLVGGTNPSMVLNYVNAVSTVNLEGTGSLDLVVTMPQSAQTDLTFTISAPLDGGSTRLDLCTLQIVSFGSNLPCMDQIPLQPEYTYTNLLRSSALVKLTSVNSLNVFSGTGANVFTLRVYFRAVDHASNTVGASLSLTSKMDWLGGTSGDMTKAFTLAAALNNSVISPDKLPTFTFGLTSGSQLVAEGESRLIQLVISLVPGQIYYPVRIELVLPFNGTAVYSICNAQVVRVGKNVACLFKDHVNSNIQFTSKINSSDIYDKAVFNMGTMTSIAPSGTTPSIDDQVTFLFSVKSQPHSLNTNGTRFLISAGMIISENQLWVGQQALFFSSTPQVAVNPLTANEFPVIFVTRTDDQTATKDTIYPLDLAVMLFTIKIRPLSQLNLTFTASLGLSAGQPLASICYVRIVSVGQRLPCSSKPTINYIPWGTSQVLNEKSVMAFGVIANSVNSSFTPSDSSLDENSIVVEAMVRTMKEITGTVSLNGLVEFNGGSVPISKVLTSSTAVPVNNTVAGTEPTFTMSLQPILPGTSLATTFAPGQAFRVAVDVTMKANTRQRMKIAFSTALSPTNAIDISSVNIASAGQNLPCMAAVVDRQVLTPRASSLTMDQGSFEIGAVCYRPVSTSATTAAVDNTFRIEAIGRLRKSTSLVGQASTTITAVVYLNSDQVYIDQKSVTLNIGTATPTELFLNVSNIEAVVNMSSISVSVGQRFEVPVVLTLPPLCILPSSSASLVSQSPPGGQTGSDTAVVIVESLVLSQGGINMAGLQLEFTNPPDAVKPVYSSSRSTSQKDLAQFNLGVVYNTDISTQYNLIEAEDPSSLTFVYNLRLADNDAAINGTQFNLSFSFTFGSVTKSAYLAVTVLRTGTETPVFALTSTLITTTVPYLEGNSITFLSSVVMDSNATTAECRKLRINIYTPQIFEFVSTDSQSYTSGTITPINPLKDGAGISYQVPYFFFDDVINVTTTMKVKSEASLKNNRHRAIVTSPVVVSCSTLNRTNNAKSGKWLRNSTSIVTDVQGRDPAADLAAILQVCGTPLGMDDAAVVKDCQISAFMSPYPGFEVVKARPSSGSYWKPFVRDGLYAGLRSYTVLFGALKKVVLLKINAQTGLAKPTQVQLYGTMDGRAFELAATMTVSYSGLVGSAIPSMPVIARGYRLVVSQSENSDATDVGLTFDLIGCPVADANTFDPCTVFPLTNGPSTDTKSAQSYFRGFLHTGTSLFYCDTIPIKGASFSTSMACYSATDAAPTVWSAMGPSVANIIGYVPSTSKLVALGQTQQGYLESEDEGITWSALNDLGWQVIKNMTGLISSTSVPWTVLPGTFANGVVGTACSTYAVSGWNFCFDGIYRGTTKHVSWNSCCSL